MPRVRTITLSDAVDEYLAMRTRKRAAGTSAGDVSICRRMLAHVGNIQVHNLRPKHLESFFYGARPKEPGLADTLSAASFNAALSRIRLFLTFCHGRGYIARDLLINIDLLKVVAREHLRLSPDELTRLVETEPEPRDRALLAIAVNTAMRASEITSRRLSDVDLDQGWLRVDVTKTSKEDMRPITVELDRELRTWLTSYADSLDVPLDGRFYLVPRRRPAGFTGPSGEPKRGFILEPTNRLSHPERVARAAFQRLGFEVPAYEGMHTLRRSVARAFFERLADQGYDRALLATKELLNHANLSQTEVYLGLSQDKQRRDESLRGKTFLAGSISLTKVVPFAAGEGRVRGEGTGS